MEGGETLVRNKQQRLRIWIGKGGVVATAIKIYALKQGFRQGLEKKGGPSDRQPTWQKPQIKKQTKSLRSLTDHHVTASAVESSLFPHKMLITSG